MLERGLKGVTIEKIMEIAEVMGVHPLTVLLDSFSSYEKVTAETLLKRIEQERNEVASRYNEQK